MKNNNKMLALAEAATMLKPYPAQHAAVILKPYPAQHPAVILKPYPRSMVRKSQRPLIPCAVSDPIVKGQRLLRRHKELLSHDRNRYGHLDVRESASKELPTMPPAHVMRMVKQFMPLTYAVDRQVMTIIRALPQKNSRSLTLVRPGRTLVVNVKRLGYRDDTIPLIYMHRGMFEMRQTDGTVVLRVTTQLLEIMMSEISDLRRTAVHWKKVGEKQWKDNMAKMFE